jgi:hypothetical protein
MKIKLTFLVLYLFNAINTNAQISKQVKTTNINRITKAASHKIPENLVYVIPYSEYKNAKYVGKINRQTKDSLLMKDFHFNFNWIMAKLANDQFSFVGPEEVNSIKQVYICKPQGPLVNPSDQNLKVGDYAALCLSDGHTIYAKINSPFYVKKGKDYEVAPGSGYLQFHEIYDQGKFYQIDLQWDASLQQWSTKKDAYGTNPYLKNGATVVAIYSYFELSEEFFDHTKTK